MKRFIVLAILAGFFAVMQVTEAATSVVYESDFSSDPNWTTDQPENFYWDESAEALYLHASVTPNGTPSRYLVTETDLDPTKSFTLSYDFASIGHEEYSYFSFGLFAPDLLNTQIRRTTPFTTPESTVNFSSSESDTRYNFQSYSYDTIIFTEGVNATQGSGGSGSAWQPQRNDWFRVTFDYDADVGKLFRTVIDLQTDTILIDSGDGYGVSGSFSENMNLLGFSLHPQGQYGTISYDPKRLEGAGTYLVDNVILTQEIEAEEPEPEPPLSDLLLQYEPILQFHEDEDYFPMNVDAFVEGSGLWDSRFIDEVLIPRGEGNGLTLDYLATTTDTSDWYIAFSSDEVGKFDLAAAKVRYDELVANGKAVPTYYAHQSEHSYMDDLGNTHEFIVLQYWYFYAMNNWRQQGGFNNHEGDWESVFVYLDRDTEEPEYVAFSAHHNDGDPSMDILQYESVRRTWENTERSNKQVHSFVAAGSHANYPDSSTRTVLTPEGNKQDLLSQYVGRADSTGNNYGKDEWKKREIIANHDALINYKGLFGTDAIGLGRAGSQGPYYTKVGGEERFSKPLEWAGIDQITKTTLEEPRSEFNLPDQNAKIIFESPLPTGTKFSSVPYEEFISFASNYENINLLPRYWDINVSEPNGSFTATTTFTYDDESVQSLNLDETKFGIYFYNDVTDLWEMVPSTLNTVTNSVTFVTNHFSIYTVGELPKNTTPPDDETDKTASTTSEQIDEEEDESEEIEDEQQSSPNTGTRVRQNKVKPWVLGASTDSDGSQRELMIQIIELLQRLVNILSSN